MLVPYTILPVSYLISLVIIYSFIGVFTYWLVRRYVFGLKIQFSENPRRIIGPFIVHVVLIAMFHYAYPATYSGLFLATHIAIYTVVMIIKKQHVLSVVFGLLLIWLWNT